MDLHFLGICVGKLSYYNPTNPSARDKTDITIF